MVLYFVLIHLVFTFVLPQIEFPKSKAENEIWLQYLLCYALNCRKGLACTMSPGGEFQLSSFCFPAHMFPYLGHALQMEGGSRLRQVLEQGVGTTALPGSPSHCPESPLLGWDLAQTLQSHIYPYIKLLCTPGL